jgi:DNA helicase TIP49 (TBP-interacting protein)
VLAGLGFDEDAVAELADAGVVRQSAARRSVNN